LSFNSGVAGFTAGIDVSAVMGGFPASGVSAGVVVLLERQPMEVVARAAKVRTAKIANNAVLRIPTTYQM
jgi:hypothetical protein